MKDFLKNILLLAVTVVACLVILEFAVRAFYPVQTQQAREVFVNYHELIPNLNMWMIDDNGEFKSRLVTNSEGMNYPYSIPYKKRNNEFRVMMVGDSFTLAAYVPFEESHHHLLEERLRKRFGDYVTVVNAGQGGSGTSQQLVYFKRKAAMYEPDVVLLYFYPNDVEDNLLRGVHRWNGGRIAEDLQPVSKGFGAEVREWLGIHSNLYVLFWKSVVRVEAVRGVMLRLGIIKSSYITSANTIPLLHLQILRSPSANSPEIESRIADGWNITTTLIKELRKSSNEAGAEFHVVIIPYKEQVDETQFSKMLAMQGWNRSDIELERAQNTLKAFLDSEGIPYLDLLPALRSANRNNSLYFDVDVHWTKAGYGVAVDQVYNYLVNGNLIPSS